MCTVIVQFVLCVAMETVRFHIAKMSLFLFFFFFVFFVFFFFCFFLKTVLISCSK